MKQFVVVVAIGIGLSGCGQEQVILNGSFEPGREYHFTVRRSKADSRAPGSETLSQVTNITSRFSAHPEGLVAEWIYGETHAEGPGELMAQIGPAQKDLLNLYRGIRVQMLLASNGEFLELLNYDSLRQQLEGAFMRMYATGLSKSSIDQYNAMKEQIARTYATEELLIGTYFKEIPLYFGLCGDTLNRVGVRKDSVYFPNPFGGEDIPAISETHVTSVTQVEVNIEVVETPDSVEFKRILIASMEGLSKELNRQRDFSDVPDFSATTTAHYAYEPENGVIRRAEQKRFIRMGETSSTEALEVVLQ